MSPLTPKTARLGRRATFALLLSAACQDPGRSGGRGGEHGAADRDAGGVDVPGTSDQDAGGPAEAGPSDLDGGRVSDAGEADASTVDADVGGLPEPVLCGSAEGSLPPGLVELALDDGGAWSSVTEQVDWVVAEQRLATTVLHQSVRFDLEHPARIHGVRVRYSDLPADPAARVEIGIHPDFGHNGFDFWPHSTYWSGDLCAGDLEEGEWVTFVVDPPVELAHPLPVHVAHRRQGEDGAAWGFDLSTPPGCANPATCCTGYATCHSAHNLPELKDFQIGQEAFYFWNGLSLSFSYDYMVRLLIEPTGNVSNEELHFQPADDGIAYGRMSWADYDGDGWDDLLAHGTTLYRNESGVLVDRTEEAGLDVLEGEGTGGVFGDYDNDGCTDLLVYVESIYAWETLFRSNCDGTFTDVTEEAGLDDVQGYNRCAYDGRRGRAASTAAAAWFDFDGDGFLDLYLGNEICWTSSQTYVDQVWHNEGDGTFTEWTGRNGFPGEDGLKLGTRGTNPIDYDRDGDVDLFVNNYHLHRDLLFVNAGDGTVEELGEALGVAGDTDPPEFAGAYGHSVGSAWGDLDNDGDFDLVVASLAHPRFYDFSDKTHVYIQGEDGRFTDIQGDWAEPWGDAGIRYQEGHFSPVLGDFDQDGNLDLVISTAYQGRVTDYYKGKGDGTFELDAYRTKLTAEYGGGLAVADVDHDGDLDIATNGGLYLNTMPAETAGHWLQLGVVGRRANDEGPEIRGANRLGVGATVRVQAGDWARVRHVTGGMGYGCQDSPTVHFGLGELDAVDSIEVMYPGGATVTYEGPFAADQRLWLLADGATVPGWEPPP